MKSIHTFVKIIILLIIAALISCVLFFVSTEDNKNYIETQGVITDYKTVVSGRVGKPGGGTSYVIRYVFMANDERVYGQSSLRDKTNIDLKTGASVKVYYNKYNINQSTLLKPSVNLAIAIPFVFAVPIGIFICIKDRNSQNKCLR